jgi:hypothetical protein
LVERNSVKEISARQDSVVRVHPVGVS